jgi:hypothetical protein
MSKAATRAEEIARRASWILDFTVTSMREQVHTQGTFVGGGIMNRASRRAVTDNRG